MPGAVLRTAAHHTGVHSTVASASGGSILASVLQIEVKAPLAAVLVVLPSFQGEQCSGYGTVGHAFRLCLVPFAFAARALVFTFALRLAFSFVAFAFAREWLGGRGVSRRRTLAFLTAEPAPFGWRVGIGVV